MSLWIIWGERNKIIWEGSSFNPQAMASRTFELLREYQLYHPPKVKKNNRIASKWETPPSGRLKINIDGFFRPDVEVAGIGMVVRDEVGRCRAAFQRSISPISSFFQAEAEACRAGLLIAINQGWNDLILETDCAALVTALANSAEDLSEIGRIVEDCKEYMLAFTSLNFRHIYREANGVAQRLSHTASFSNIDNFWVDDTPSIIEDVIYKDLCPHNRGFGNTAPSM